MSLSISSNGNASSSSAVLELPHVNAEPVQIPGELAVLADLDNRYHDTFLREPTHGDPWATPAGTFPAGSVSYGPDTSGPVPVQDGNYLAVAPHLRDFLNFGESSLTPAQTRDLAYRLGQPSGGFDSPNAAAHPGDRVEMSIANADGSQSVTRGIVLSSTNEGTTVLGVKGQGDDSRFTTFFQSASQPDHSSATITQVITPAA